MEGLLPTTVVGSYPQPDWLVDRDRLIGEGVPRVRAAGIWTVDPGARQEAIEAAVLQTIADQESAGVQVITDGECGRESYFNHFANSLSGVDTSQAGKGLNRRGGEIDVPLVSGPIRWTEPVELDAARFLVAHATHQTKVTVPGPFTLSQLAQDDYYGNRTALAMAYATAINAELRELEAAGVDVLQLDEPYLQANAADARGLAVEAISEAVEGITATTTLHTCFGYAIYMGDKSGGYPFLNELAGVPVDYVSVEAAQPRLNPKVFEVLAPRSVVLGVIDLSTETVETPEVVAERITAALKHIDADRLAVAPDCGMKFLKREVAQAKLAAMVQGASLVRSQLQSHPT